MTSLTSYHEGPFYKQYMYWNDTRERKHYLRREKRLGRKFTPTIKVLQRNTRQWYGPDILPEFDDLGDEMSGNGHSGEKIRAGARDSTCAYSRSRGETKRRSRES